MQYPHIIINHIQYLLSQLLYYNQHMSDQQFEFEKQIANVSQLKSFANFKNNYNKKFSKEPQEPPRQTLVKSNQKLSNSYEKQKQYERQYHEPSEERKMKVIKEEPDTSDFYQNEVDNSYGREKQVAAQQINPPKVRVRGREFSQAQSYQQPMNSSLNHLQKQFKPLKQTVQTVPYEKTFPAPPIQQSNNDSSYKAKFQQLSSVFEEFKNSSLVEKRKHKQQLFENEELIERLKVRVYELQIREDELTMENKKLNQKLTKDFKTQKQSQSLKSLLQSRTEQLRRAMEEINYYRGQLDGNRKQLQSINLDSERYTLELRELRERLEYQQMEIQNKERLQGQLSQKISGLIKENARLRDEVSDLFRANKELEFENYSIKRQLKRGGQNGDSYNQYLNSKQSQQSYRVNIQQQSTVEHPKPETKRRRGQFNQQRNKVNGVKQIKQTKQVKQQKDTSRREQTTRKEPNPEEQLLKRKDELEEQIGKMKEQRPMNGAMRRIKIALEQELEQIIKKLSGAETQKV